MLCDCGSHGWVAIGKRSVAYVDPADDPIVAGISWKLSNKHYARSSGTSPVLMHRLILDPPKHLSVDHINGDGLDNRRLNLRLSTHAENMRNRKKHKHSTSRFKGIYFDKRFGRYYAVLICSGKRIRGNRRVTDVDAARDYDRMAIEAFGPFARTNQSLGLLDAENKKGDHGSP